MAVASVPLRFAVFNSKIELPFYSVFFDAKLNHDKLDDSVRPLIGLYETPKSPDPEGSCLMQIHATALTSKQAPPEFARAEGKLKNVNTLDTFKNLDKHAILSSLGQQIWDAIKDGTIYSSPSLLSSYFLISYADLKKYRFMYWFGFPALHSEPQWKRVGPIGRLEPNESTALVESIGTWRYQTDGREHGFFLAKKIYGVEGDHNPYDNPDLNIGYKWVIGSLRDFETGFFHGIEAKDQFISFLDPSTYPENPGWPLRNLLILIRHRYQLRKTQVLCFRDVQSRRHEARSIILPLEMDPVETTTKEIATLPKITGWERNPSGKLSARITTLSDYLDPARLADQAVDLNLKLMKWRIAPGLDLDSIKRTKCLLLGAGTLGGYVARSLMGWGVRHITFVDNGAVSYSNPIRQPLFTFEDCLNGGAPKATRSADALRAIYPGVETAGHVITVPMLGHPITPDTEDKMNSDFIKLQKLFSEHDAIFLLMDTRESRWLPTVMGKAQNKLVLNAALGFDSYVVMRHGAKPTEKDKKTLGCYFCNDIMAPGDSVKDSTLDQQCTVTRPGVSTIASALLVEMFTSILQHKLKHNAPAPKTAPTSALSYERDPPDHPLGLVPHQIRGFLGSFQNMILRGENYPNCSACSDPVLDAYSQDGWDFVTKALSDNDYIPELSGLAEVQRQAEKMLEEEGNFDYDEMEDEGDGELV